MQGNTFFVATLFLQQFSTIRSSSKIKIEIKECLPGLDYRQDCNRCWCVSDGNILVCDKMDCKAVPRKMWAKVKLKKITEKDRSMLLAALAAGGLILQETGLVDVAKTEIKKLVISKIVPYVEQGVVQAANSLYNTAKKVVNTVGNAVKKAANTVGHALKNAWNAFRGWFG